jgi:hypothetical protein
VHTVPGCALGSGFGGLSCTIACSKGSCIVIGLVALLLQLSRHTIAAAAAAAAAAVAVVHPVQVLLLS